MDNVDHAELDHDSADDGAGPVSVLGGQDRFVVEELGVCAAPEVFRLHRQVLETLERPDFFYRHNLDFFRDLSSRPGSVVGIRDRGALVAYKAMRPPGHPANEHWRLLVHLGLGPNDVAEGAGCAVAPACRGLRAMSFLGIAQEECSRRLGVRVHSAVVAPHNLGALIQIFDGGYLAAANAPDASGDNYLLVKYLDGFARQGSCHETEGIAKPLHDVSGNLKYLCDGGWIGVPGWQDGTRAFFYRPASELAWCRPGGRDGKFENALSEVT